MPANQGFRTDQAAIRQTDLRLVEQFEFVSLGGERKFGLQRQPRFKFFSNGVFEQHVTAAPGRLGATKREMAVAQEFVSRLAPDGVDGCADTDLDPVLARSSEKRSVERELDTLGQLRDSFGDDAGKRDGEFIAAQSRDDSLISDLRI